MFSLKDIILMELRGLLLVRHQLSRHRLYSAGVESLESDFDIVRLVKTLRKVDLLTELLLSDHHRGLLPYTKHFRLSYDNAAKEGGLNLDQLESHDVYLLNENNTPIDGLLRELIQAEGGPKDMKKDRADKKNNFTTVKTLTY
jgi:hypothetical protein